MASPRSRTDLHIRPFSSEVRRWKALARQDEVSLTDWIREHLNVFSLPPAPEVLPTITGPQLPLPRVK